METLKLPSGESVTKGTLLVHASGGGVSRVMRFTGDPHWPLRVKSYGPRGVTGVGSIGPNHYHIATAAEIAAVALPSRHVPYELQDEVATLRAALAQGARP